ncbi:serine hydrolase domain-containing protein [Thiovibrio frasassiensis]|uniref:Beta-lactamase family protein n=1 Tax=Thiovibrio frasassiensis TaxID=2984131 RepID=A0A9X4MMG7_9BACT|nr:serine hydrolase domain-containing protein [Thiovibrio frasassiensis]MDG4475502.1 beta-lactamase family protein [Thiovibrio frasassiensis]
MGVAWGLGEKRKSLIQPYGYTDYSQEKRVTAVTVYDLASLTKPLATVLAVLTLLQEQRLQISDLVSDIFPQASNSFLHRVSIKDLLCHCSGFPAHKPYYLELIRLPAEKRKEMLLNLLFTEAPAYETGTASVYSDLGFMLLGLIVEKKSGCRLDHFFREKIAEPLGIAEKIFYGTTGPEGKGEISKALYAPTEECPFRKRLLCGEVSDENCHALGGVAGHAGLFGTIEGVLEMGVQLLEQWQGRKEHSSYRASDLQRFLIPRNIPGSTWALGFDTPSATGSSGGRYLAPTSVGHLGFTGTSLWIDPTRDLVMVLLSNRVHPSRENIRIKQFRPLFHETVMESLGLV